jgi:hypothetical protein
MANVNIIGTDLTTGKNRPVLSTDIATDNEGTPIGGSGSFSTVASSSADYTTVKAALDDSKTKIQITGSVSETIDIVPSNVDIYIRLDPGITWTFNNGINIALGSYTSNFTIEFRDSTLAYNLSAFTTLLSFGAAKIYFKGNGTIDNNSTVNNTSLFSTSVSEFYMLGTFRFEAPAREQGGIVLPINGKFYIDDLTMVGPNGACSYVLSGGSNGVGLINKLTIEGTFDTGSNSLDQVFGLDNTSAQAGPKIEEFIIDITSDSYMSTSWTIGSMVIVGAGAPIITFANGAAIHGGDLTNTTTIGVTGGSTSGNLFKNTSINMSAISWNNSDQNIKLINCRGNGSTDDLSLQGPFAFIMGCTNMGEITLTGTGLPGGSGADSGIIMGNQCGDITSTGGSETINVDPVRGAIVINNHTDIAVNNVGGGFPVPVVADNIIY